MRITRHQLRRMIAEAMPRGGAPDVVGATTGVPGGNIQNLVDEYKEWAVDYMGSPSGPNSSSVLATFLVDRGLDQGPMADNIMKDMAREMRFDIVDVRREVERQREEYDAGGTESDQEIHQRSFKEGKMRISKRQLRRIIREEKARLIKEGAEELLQRQDPSSEPDYIKTTEEWVDYLGQLIDQDIVDRNTSLTDEGGPLIEALEKLRRQYKDAMTSRPF